MFANATVDSDIFFYVTMTTMRNFSLGNVAVKRGKCRVQFPGSFDDIQILYYQQRKKKGHKRKLRLLSI